MGLGPSLVETDISNSVLCPVSGVQGGPSSISSHHSESWRELMDRLILLSVGSESSLGRLVRFLSPSDLLMGKTGGKRGIKGMRSSNEQSSICP